MSSRIAQMILNQARRTGADPYTLLATAIVESNLNPRAVGDNGTSYGLFQMHVGGAGGSTHDSARRYLDPRTAIENRARHFRGGSGGSFAASVQRPADPAGYARKVDAIIQQLRSGKHPALKGGLWSDAGMRSESLSVPSNGTPDRKAAALALIFDNDPIFALAAQRSNTGNAPASTPTTRTNTGGFGWTKGKERGSYKDLIRLGKQFGLNIQGDFQTTGGRHSRGSYHYQQRAVDFGDATNSEQDMRALAAYVRQNPEQFTEFFWTPAGFSVKNGKVLEGHSIPRHNDHIHLARQIRKGGKR